MGHIDEKRYEKIDGREAIKRLLEGQKIFDKYGGHYDIDKEYGTMWMVAGEFRGEVNTSFNKMLLDDWYIPKPFDVRQAMRDRPNEWVGACDVGGIWMKVGFDEEQMQAVEGAFDYHGTANMSASCCVGPNYRIPLDKCIPIEEVPEGANIRGLKPTVAVCEEEE